ncbi:MAG: nucleotidyl transferase AbiEii/AbiGii toxin family protein [Candidatus Symbiothrix sp.]|nr:nucleotidyl transferase AbiEii/AbiGii toxin family protein [Candidatus Symbiothrix sp.]
MIYNISSKKLDNPLLKDLLKELTVFFNSIGVDFYIVGATARDIVLCNLYEIISNRKTDDLDIAIAIADWEQFALIEQQLSQRSGFKKDRTQKQRFLYRDVYKVDIVPFGTVAKEDGNIYWPPNEEVAMSVWGFPEVAKETLTIQVDNDLIIRVASLPGLFLLKLSAWEDRNSTSKKDAFDIALLLVNYLNVNEKRAVDDYYDELYATDSFDPVIAGAQLIAHDVNLMLQGNADVLNRIKDIMSTEIALAEESRLINQLLESNGSLKYEQVLSCLEMMIEEWNTNIIN